MATPPSIDSITSTLSSLSIQPTTSTTNHAAATNPADWRAALEAASEAPKGFELLKTLIYKPKTAKTATPVPVVVIARELTETNSGSIGKALNLKELRLASPDLLTEFFGVDKDSVSPLSITKEIFSKVQTVVDKSLDTSSAPLALHANSSSSSIFLSGSDILKYLRSLETDENKVTELDFAEIAAGSVTSQAQTSTAPPATKEDARIEGAVQIAIGVKKEVDFPTWYTNVRSVFSIF
jgi:prolyl-tRNA synthetase